MKNKTTLFAVLAALVILAAAYGIMYVVGLEETKSAEDTSEEVTDTQYYVYERTGFRLALVAGFSARLADGDATDIVIVENDKDASVGYQVAITPWDEPADALSFARIQTDLPDLEISRPQAGALPIGVLALSFQVDQGGEETREIWFVHKGYLYQISAPVDAGKFLEDALEDMSFRKQ